MSEPHIKNTIKLFDIRIKYNLLYQIHENNFCVLLDVSFPFFLYIEYASVFSMLMYLYSQPNNP